MIKKHTMKNILYLLTFLSTQLLFSQSNEIKARIEFEDAEKYFSDANYNEALTHLNNAQKLIGSWNHKISYMKIMCYDAIVNYYDWDQSIENLNKEVQLYMAYADNNSNKVDTDKFRQIYSIEEKIKNSKNIKDNNRKTDEWKKMSEDIEGRKALNNRDYNLAFKYFKKAADKGNGCSMEAIGFLYREGYGVEKNYFTALEWYKKAFQSGFLACSTLIGNLYDTGFNDFKENDHEAYKWYLKAAETNYRNAIDRLGDFFRYGWGVDKNLDEAKIYYKKAALLGDPNAMNSYGELIVNENSTEALDWFKKAAAHNNSNAMVNLGDYHRKRNEINLALKFYEDAAILKDDDALYKLAEFYDNGWGVAKNSAKALEYYKLAAEYGWKNYEYNYGTKLYFEKRYDEAIIWWDKAIAKGYKIENYNVKKSDAYWDKKDYAKALEALIEEYNIGFNDNKWRIAKIYRNGLGVPKNKELAREWENK